jgi:hypothetical protein
MVKQRPCAKPFNNLCRWRGGSRSQPNLLSHRHRNVLTVATIGPPKAGNHLLVKVVGLMGAVGHVEHVEYAKVRVRRSRTIFIKRDPRNIVLSWQRAVSKSDTYAGAMWAYEGKGIVKALADYEGWLQDADTLVVRFEDMYVPSQLQEIADYVDAPLPDDILDSLPGGTFTWSGELSDYRAVWSDEVQAAWNSIGGEELRRRWGYQ